MLICLVSRRHLCVLGVRTDFSETHAHQWNLDVGLATSDLKQRTTVLQGLCFVSLAPVWAMWAAPTTHVTGRIDTARGSRALEHDLRQASQTHDTTDVLGRGMTVPGELNFERLVETHVPRLLQSVLLEVGNDDW